MVVVLVAAAADDASQSPAVASLPTGALAVGSLEFVAVAEPTHFLIGLDP